jgi:hypothetical protein
MSSSESWRGNRDVQIEDRSPPPSLVAVENETFLALSAFQAELRRLGEGWKPRDADERRIAIANANWIRAWISAGSNRLGPGRVKRLQLAAAAGEPLMICAGLTRMIGDGNGDVVPLSDDGWRDGCGGVCRDSPKTVGRKLFRAYCSECGRLKLARKHHQHERTRYFAELEERFWGFTRRASGVLYIRRCRCGALFHSTDIRQTACGDCHEKHRTGLVA